MDFFPQLELTLMGGWLFLVGEWSIPILTLLLVPKNTRQRLVDRSNFSRKQKIILIIGKLFGLVEILLVFFTPLALNSLEFNIGFTVYIFGMMGLIIALINYAKTPINEPVTRGIYRISRNPQDFMLTVGFFGTCLIVGSIIAILILIVAKIFSHFAILAEEEACLRQYGNSYQDYLKRVPRYFLFF